MIVTLMIVSMEPVWTALMNTLVIAQKVTVDSSAMKVIGVISDGICAGKLWSKMRLTCKLTSNARFLKIHIVLC